MASHEQAHAHHHGDHGDPPNITNPEHAEHHIVTPLQYCFVFAALLAGTAITVGVAKLDLPDPWNAVMALLIACTKAAIVILFFMHVKFQSRLIKFTVGAGFLTFLILIGMTLSDYMSRAWGLW